MKFQLTSQFQPAGDQPEAIKELTTGVENDKKHQTLLGVTGSGKTFTMANIIQNTQRPTLIVVHNKTLAAQLYQEFRDFFPKNAVSYFVSYYDYYQPEAYIPSSDTYIEKTADINEEIDKLRLATTTNLLTRPDSIVIASVSCIYNLGSPVAYAKTTLMIMEGEVIQRETLMLQLSNLQYERSESDLLRGTFRLRGDTIQVWPAYQDTAYNIDTLEDKITKITQINPISGSPVAPTKHTDAYSKSTSSNTPVGSKSYKPEIITIYPAKHYQFDRESQNDNIKVIEKDLKKRLAEYKDQGKTIEAYRLQQKVNYDLEMIREFGFVNGIENYSRYFDGRKPGEPPSTLLDYFAASAEMFDTSYLTFIDESHITIPQVKGMYFGDHSRKNTLIDYGFRLPSAIDNRPLKLHEFVNKNQNTIYFSATPKEWEIERSGNHVSEQIIRPTGLIDPTIEIRPVTGQVDSLVIEVIKRKQLGQRVLVTTLTKKMSEALADYLNDKTKIDALLEKSEYSPPGHSSSDLNDSDNSNKPFEYPSVAYLHSDIVTLERTHILADLRRGKYDVLVGINLLREGLDLPEVSLVAILDADKEGFLRSTTSMIQTIGRAARHLEGKAILFADRITKSMKAAIDETDRRRNIQIAYNKKHNITPQSISKPIREDLLKEEVDNDGYIINSLGEGDDLTNELGSKVTYINKNTGKKLSKKPLIIDLSKKESIDIANLDPDELTPEDRRRLHSKIRRKMKQAANELDYELATLLRNAAEKIE